MDSAVRKICLKRFHHSTASGAWRADHRQRAEPRQRQFLAEACVDGQSFEVVVAEEEDGIDARLYKGHCRITCDFLIDKSKNYKIKFPEVE